MSCCDLIKACLVLESEVIQGKDERILRRVISLLKSNSKALMNEAQLKIKLLETLSAFVYKGYTPLLQKLMSPKNAESQTLIFITLLDSLNTS
jgi:hypothetical protein